MGDYVEIVHMPPELLEVLLALPEGDPERAVAEKVSKLESIIHIDDMDDPIPEMAKDTPIRIGGQIWEEGVSMRLRYLQGLGYTHVVADREISISYEDFAHEMVQSSQEKVYPLWGINNKNEWWAETARNIARERIEMRRSLKAALNKNPDVPDGVYYYFHDNTGIALLRTQRGENPEYQVMGKGPLRGSDLSEIFAQKSTAGILLNSERARKWMQKRGTFHPDPHHPTGYVMENRIYRILQG